MSARRGIETVIGHHLFRPRAERFGDLRERQDLRRSPAGPGAALRGSRGRRSAGRRATTAAARSVILLIGRPPRCRGRRSRASRSASGGRALRRSRRACRSGACRGRRGWMPRTSQDEQPRRRTGQQGGGAEDEVQQHRYSALPGLVVAGAVRDGDGAVLHRAEVAHCAVVARAGCRRRSRSRRSARRSRRSRRTSRRRFRLPGTRARRPATEREPAGSGRGNPRVRAVRR